jgi:hypothetical protein
MRKDIGLAGLSALLGVALGYLIGDFDVTSLKSWLLLIAILFGILGSLAFVGPLGLVLRSPGRVKLGGQWVGHWEYKKGRQIVTVHEQVRLWQYGQFLKGESHSTQITGPHPLQSVHYELRGRVRPDGVVDGQWWNVEEDRRYRGVFQGKVHIAGSKLSAFWIGTDDSGVRTGSWSLERSGRA